MSLPQFQSVLRTFVDDEMAFVADRTTSSSAFNNTVDENYVGGAVAEDFTGFMEKRMSNMDNISYNGNKRRRLQRRMNKRKRDEKRKNDDNAHGDGHDKFHIREDERIGRFHNSESIPEEVQSAWDGIVSHAWDMAKLFSSSHAGETSPTSQERGLKRKDKGGKSNDDIMLDLSGDNNEVVDIPPDSESEIHNIFSTGPETSIIIDEEVEIATDWSEEIDSLFLVCHSSNQPMDGNTHMEQILIASGKDVRFENDYFDVVHSDPTMVCVILGMQPTFAWSIAEKFQGVGAIALVPWVDIMKISPELFESITRNMNVDSEDHSEEDEEDLSPVRGLRKFQRAVEAITEDSIEESVFWVNEIESKESLSDQYIVFSLVPPSSLENANSVLQDLIAMAANGRRRRLGQNIDINANNVGIKEDHRRKLRSMTLHDAFSITKSNDETNEKQSGSKPENHWSRILETGIESEHSCSSLLDDISIQPSFGKSSYEFHLQSYDNLKSSSVLSCVASLIAGLAVHPLVVNVGLLSKRVALDNASAQYAIQGAVKTSSESQKRPYFDAGLDGSGQIVSVSDTGLDTRNCYFRDDDGNGDIFSMVRYGSIEILFLLFESRL